MKKVRHCKCSGVPSVKCHYEVRDILNYPSGLYAGGYLIIQRRVGWGFLIMEETHHCWIELRRYDENGLLAETM